MNVVYLGIGTIVLLWISFNLYRKRKNKNRVVSVTESRCTACRRCVRRCTRRVLEAVEDETGIRVVVGHPEWCTACGDCLGKCKFNALNLIERT